MMETMKEINLNVNGMPRKIIVDPKKTLLKVLREDLRADRNKGRMLGRPLWHLCGDCGWKCDSLMQIPYREGQLRNEFLQSRV